MSRWLAASLALFAGAAALAAEIPKLASPVTDLTGTLAAEQVAALERKSLALQQAKGSQLVVLIVPTTQPETIEQYAVEAFEQNAIGRKGVDDGVLLLVAKDDRKVRIEVGYGLEGAIPDIYANRIISEYLTPQFRAGDFYGGIDAATTQLQNLILGEALPEPLAANDGSTSSSGGGGDVWIFAAVMGFIVASVIGGMASGFRKSGARGLVAAVLSSIAAFLLTHSLVGLAVAAFFGFVFAMAKPSGRSVGGRGYGGGFGGGGFGGGSSGGGGGWSGGGGRSGGGGASGSW